MKRQTKLTVLIDRIKLVFALAAMAFIAYLFTFYLDADVGVIVCAFMLAAPLLSVLFAWYASRFLRVSMKVPDTLQKGRHFPVKVHVESDGKLPVPFLRVQLAQDANFVRDDERPAQAAMIPREPLDIDYGMTAQYAGSGMISCGSLAVSDYLGLFSFRVKELPAPAAVGVIPEVPSLTGAANMLRTVSNMVLTMDEEEEESSASFTNQSLPGYVHRDYVPGDNLRRINWKLSAKRNRLMVRMDEAASAVRPTVILDLQHEIDVPALKRRETMLEGALGFLLLLVRQGIPCGLRFADGGEWKCLELDSEDAVRLAAVELSTADFANNGSRIDPEALTEKAGACMVYTTRPDDLLDAQLRALKQQGYVCCVFPVFPEIPALSGADALWQLAEDFAMTAVKN